MWTRIAAPVAVVSCLLLVMAVGAAWYVHTLQASTSEMVTNNLASVHAAHALETSIRDTRMQFDRYLVTGEKKFLDPIPQLKLQTDEALRAVEATGATPTEQQLIHRIRHGYQELFEKYDALLVSATTQGIYYKIIELNDTLMAKEVLAPAREYTRWNEGMLAQAEQANRELADRLIWGLLGLGLCGAFGGLLAGWVIASAIRRNIQRTEERLRLTARWLLGAVPDGSTETTAFGDPIEDVTKSAAAVLSRLKRTEQEALRAEQLALVGQMAAGIAHEVRNPLMAIKLLVQALGDTDRAVVLEPKHVLVLEEEILRLEHITSTFLDFARPPRLERRPVEVGPMVEQVALGTRSRAEAQGVQITVDLPARPVVADVDGNQLRQVLYNLAFNAIEAQPNGGKVGIVVRAAPGSGGEPVLTIRVWDTGPGLPTELGERIFEPFVSTKATGLGLGLSICRRIVESHGGTLQAISGEQGGADLTITLPLRKAARAAAQASRSAR